MIHYGCERVPSDFHAFIPIALFVLLLTLLLMLHSYMYGKSLAFVVGRLHK